MKPELDKFVAEVHKRRGFPKSPAWAVCAEHYIGAFCREVEKRAKLRCKNTGCAAKSPPCGTGTLQAFRELKDELLSK